MRTVKASEARRRWFELLDAVVEGEEVVIERKGRRVVMRSEPIDDPAPGEVPDYSDVLDAPSLDEADRWGWDWTLEGLEPREA